MARGYAPTVDDNEYLKIKTKITTLHKTTPVKHLTSRLLADHVEQVRCLAD